MGAKILIVDDSLTMLRILKTSAKMVIKDVEVLEAMNGQEALDKLEENGDIKLILLDINMPVMNGREFLAIIRTRPEYDDVKVIIQTTETSKEHIKKMMQYNISGYLMKPYQTKMVQQLMIKLAPVIGYELVEE
ncbi:MAG: response regulator [Campylobacterota bacterium]|nr:response regulator [Campylobacterota bacterium]